MGLINCPECGKEISENLKRCPYCGFRIHKKRMFIGIILICLTIFILGMILWVLVAANWSVDNAKKIVNGHLECLTGHEWQPATCQHGLLCSKCGAEKGEIVDHTWQDATCTLPETCLICSLTRGEPLGHEWRDATCEEPKTCTRCWETEGKALGHSRRIGYCNRCGEYQTKLLDRYEELGEIVNNILDDYEDCVDYFQNASITHSEDMCWYYLERANIEAWNIKDEYEELLNKCGNLAEFSKAKKWFSKAEIEVAAYPRNTVLDNGYYDISTVAEKIKEGVQTSLDFCRSGIEELSKYAE